MGSLFGKKAGDNLLLVAKQHNTTVNVLQDVNKMSSSMIRVGQELMIPVAGNNIESYTLSSHQRLLAKQSKAPNRNRIKINYTVNSGDSLWLIANKYKTDTKTLARWNNMGLGDPLMPGKKLVLWLEPEQSKTNNSTRSVIKKVIYTIRSGESLAVVANKFKVSVNDIREWNPKVSSKKYRSTGRQSHASCKRGRRLNNQQKAKRADLISPFFIILLLKKPYHSYRQR